VHLDSDMIDRFLRSRHGLITSYQFPCDLRRLRTSCPRPERAPNWTPAPKRSPPGHNREVKLPVLAKSEPADRARPRAVT
jgi:hypothetical protein